MMSTTICKIKISREEAPDSFTLRLNRTGLQGRYGTDYDGGSFVDESDHPVR